MRSRQRGATFLGMVTIIAILGFGLYAVIRLVPIYVEYMAVSRALNQTSEDFRSVVANPASLKQALDRRWIIEDIKTISTKDIEIRKGGPGYTMRAWYRAEAPFVGNVSLVAEFDKTVEVQQ